MNEEHTSNWNELVSRWQSAGAAISAEDVRRRARRLHLQALGIAIAEVLASLIGLSTAVWIASATSMLFVGVGFGLGILLFTLRVLSWQWRTHLRKDSAEDAISALVADVDREEAAREMFRTGYGVVLAAMLAVVVAASSQLINFRGGAASQFLPLIASGAYLVGCMALAILLERRARRRAKVFRTLREHLIGDPGLHKGVNSLVAGSDESGI
jgi:hypothetical protein